MFSSLRFGSFLTVLVLPLNGVLCAQFYAVNRYATGQKPLGVASVQVVRPSGAIYVAAANSASNSVSLFRLMFDSRKGALLTSPSPVPATFTAPSPYSVVACGSGFLVTSSAGDTVTWLRLFVNGLEASNAELRTIRVGPLPYSAACYADPNSGLTAVVSTASDNTLSIVDLESGTVAARIGNVPASRALHGIVIDPDQVAWVAGTDADIVSVVGLRAGKLLARLPLRGPLAVSLFGNSIAMTSGIENTVSLVDWRTLLTDTTWLISAHSQDCDLPYCTTGGAVVRTLFDSRGQAYAGSVVPDVAGAFGLHAVATTSTTAALVTSTDSNAVFTIVPVQTPQEFGIANAASFEATKGLAPGSLASLFADTGIFQAQKATLTPLPLSLAGITVVVGGTFSYSVENGVTYSSVGALPAPLLFVDGKQVNFQLPMGISPGDVPMQLRRADGSTLLGTVRVVSRAPGVFTVLPTGSGPGAVLNEDNTLNLPTNPAARGSTIQIFATGAGVTNPPVPSGVTAPSSPLSLTPELPFVTIDGVPAPVRYSGLAPGFVGLWQINVAVPTGGFNFGRANTILVTAGGVTSKPVTVAIK